MYIVRLGVMLSLFLLAGAAESKRCFEVVVQPGRQASSGRFYDVVQAIHLLRDANRTVFQVGMLSTSDKDLTDRLAAAIRYRFYAMKSAHDCALLSDAQKVLRSVVEREIGFSDPRITDVSYVQQQFFFNGDAHQFEDSVPEVLLSKEAQAGQEAPVVSINADVCKAAALAYRLFYGGDW